MNLMKCGALLIAAWCTSSVALGQETCQKTESIQGCFDRIVTATHEAAPLEVERDQKRELALSQTGADTAGAATASTVTDLAPLFDALGLLGDSDSSNGTLTLNLNFLLPVQQADHNAQLKLLVNTQPEPLTQLVDSFADIVRTARKDALQKDIDAFGDTQLAFTWSLMNSRFGRDFRAQRAVLAPIYEGAIARARATQRQLGTQKFLEILGELTKALPADRRAGASTTSVDSLPIDESLKTRLLAATAEVAQETVATSAAVRTELTRTRIDRLADLVNQQPQLLFSLSHDIRDELVGPEKTSATATFEFTNANLGSFLRGNGARCKQKTVAEGTADYNGCVAALQNYLGDDAQNLTTQPRWKVSAAYQRVKAVTYAFPNDGVELTLPNTDRLEVTVALGRPLQQAKNADRIDFEVSYDSNIDNDASDKERIKAALTYTRRVGDMDVPFAIVYANKSEFLGDVDQQISLHLGVKFRALGDPK